MIRRSLATHFSRGGFTLVEILVGLAVLAVLASLSSRGLSAILDAEARASEELKRWNRITAYYAQLADDLSCVLAKPARDEKGLLHPAFSILTVANNETGSGSSSQLELTRTGDTGAGAPVSEPFRVGYRLRNGRLEHLLWPALPAAPGSPTLASPILNNVAEFSVRALGQDGTWVPSWPPGAQSNRLPRAVEARITLESGERLTRILLLR